MALYGAGEVAELAYLSLQELDMELVGVYADEDRGKIFLGSKVLGRDQFADATFDQILVTSFDHPENAVGELVASGVAPERIVTLRGPVFCGAANKPARRQSPSMPAARTGAAQQ